LIFKHLDNSAPVLYLFMHVCAQVSPETCVVMEVGGINFTRELGCHTYRCSSSHVWHFVKNWAFRYAVAGFVQLTFRVFMKSTYAQRLTTMAKM
jgi:hypothetical protein